MKKTELKRKGDLSQETIDLVQQLLGSTDAQPDDMLFSSTADTLRVRVNRFLKQYGHTSHDFRHTKITELARKGLPVKVMQVLAGHSCSTTTMRYISVDQDEALDQVKGHHLTISSSSQLERVIVGEPLEVI